MKKVLKKSLAILLAMICALNLSILSFAAGEVYTGTCGENLTWNFNAETGELVISGNGEMQDYEYSFPPQWDQYDAQIKTVTIMDGVTSIGSYAFRGANFTDISIPDSVTSIGSLAFYECYKTENIYYQGDIGDWCEITFADQASNPKYDQADAVFYADGKPISRKILIPEGTEKITNYAFYFFKELTEVIIPDTVKSIGAQAFSSCNSLARLTLSSSVKSIGSEAFVNSFALKEIYFNGDIGDWCEIDFYNVSANPLCQGGSLYINEELVEGIVTIPQGTTRIGNWAFYNLKSISSVDIPDSVTSIGNNAFERCSNLTDVNLPDSIVSIAPNTFYLCLGLTNIIIPDSVEIIDDYAFYWCSGLTSITIPNSVKQIKAGAFQLCNYITDIYYIGTQEQWEEVYIGNNNQSLLQDSVRMHFIVPDEESAFVNYNYSYNGGTSATATRVTVDKGASIPLTPTATKSGWTFVGWNTDPDATTGLSSLTMGTSDVTLYAIYKKSLTATFIDYNGTSEQTRTASVTIYNNATSATVTPPSQSTYTGWENRGWSTSTSANAGVANSYTISSDTTYYGLYNRTLTLSYNKNGGSSTPSSQTGTQYVNSYSITSYKNPSFTLASAIKKTGSTFEGWAFGSTDGTKYNEGSIVTISSDITMYAIWGKNVYNLGEETYSFSNYSDSDTKKEGHCFGMSITSAGYYLGELDISGIGIDDSSELSTVSKTSAVKEPICFYQDKQGSYSVNAIVAGGTYYKNYSGNNVNSYDIESDWDEVINYVKNHNYDNTGALQIGYRNYKKGHAINFLRYERVNGQDRIYAYDNNYPDIETYFCKESDGKVYQKPQSSLKGSIDCIALRDVSKYFSEVKDFDYSRVIYAPAGSIEIEGIYGYSMESGVLTEEYMMYEIPEGIDQITIIPLVDNATFEYINEEYRFGKITDETYGQFTLSSTEEGSDDNIDFTIINEKKGTVHRVSLEDISLDYKSETIIVPNIVIDEGVECTVSYSSSDNSVLTVDGNGKVTAKGKGDATITCTVTDEYGDTVTDTCEVNVKYTWWQWIIVIVLFGWIWY